MFDKSFNYFIPKNGSVSETEQKDLNQKRQFRIVSVNRMIQVEKDNYIPLVSPQLSAYAKPSERIKLQQKLMRVRQNNSVSLHSNITQSTDKKHSKLNFSRENNTFDAAHGQNQSKLNTENSLLSSEDNELKVIGGQLFQSKENYQIKVRKQKRKPKTHRNIFSLYFQESLELNQLRKKMNPQFTFSNMDPHVKLRQNGTQLAFQNLKIDTPSFIQYGRKCKMQQKALNILSK